MFKRIALICISLLLVISISGCIGGGGGYSATDGAVIKEFLFDVAEIEDAEGEQAILTFSFENVGAKTMDGTTEFYVYGPSMTKASKSTWKTDDVTETVNRIEWDMSVADFYPPDPETGQPGMGDIRVMYFAPPNLAEGMTDSYTFYGRICYPYRTSTISVVESIGRNEYKIGDITRTEAETRNSAGPIQLALQAGQTIRVRSSTDTTELPLVFEVTDLGGGFVTPSVDDEPSAACDPNIEKKYRDTLYVSVEIDGEVAECGDGLVRLRDGVGTLYCKGTFSNPNPKSEYHITTLAKYNYYITEETSIGVSDSIYDEDVEITEKTPTITITAPTEDYVNTLTPTITLDTDKTAECRYSIGTSKSFNGMDLFTTTNTQAGHSVTLGTQTEGSTVEVYIKCQDTTGLMANAKAEFAIDTTEPTTSLSPAPDADWHDAAQTFTLGCADDGSGCDKISYCSYVGTTECTTFTEVACTSIPCEKTISISAEGENYIRYMSEDEAGNTPATPTTSPAIKIDTQPPTTTLDQTISTGWYDALDTMPQTFTLTCTDGGSGCKTDGTLYCTDQTSTQCTPDTTYTTTGIPISAEGSTYLGWKSEDTVGHLEDVQRPTDPVRVDTLKPLITHTCIPSGPLDTAISVTADPVVDDTTSTTDVSGIATVALYYKKSSETTYTSLSMAGTGDSYTVDIPAGDVTEDINYYISAEDVATNPATFPADAPTTVCTVTVT